MSVVDGYIGEVLDEIEKLGIADNSIVMVMGDNGPMTQDPFASGYKLPEISTNSYCHPLLSPA